MKIVLSSPSLCFDAVEAAALLPLLERAIPVKKTGYTDDEFSPLAADKAAINIRIIPDAALVAREAE